MLGCLLAEIHWDAQFSLCLQCSSKYAPDSEKLLILHLAATESRKGAQQCISQIYACLDPRATNHASRYMMAEESDCTTQYRMNASECYNKNLTPSWVIRSVGDLGIETRSVTRSMKRASFPVPGLTPIPNTMQYAWYA